MTAEMARRPLSILMVCPQFRPMIGGYEQAAERLSQALSERGNAITVVTERRLKSWPKFERIGRIDVRRLWCAARRGLHSASGVFSFTLFLLLRGRSFDVFHVHQYGWYSSVAIALGRLLRRPVVLKLTNTGPHGIGPVLSAMPLASLHRGLHRRLDACIATSERARDEALSLGIEAERVHVIPNGLDVHHFRPPSGQEREAARRRLGLGPALLAVTVCRLRPEKDLFLLLEAWRRLQDHPSGIGPVTLAIVGGGPLFDPLKARAAESGLGTSVQMPGDSADPLPWYQAANLYLLSSLNEGLSNSLMEAVSCGLAFVSTRVSGSEDILREADAGEGVPVGDADAFASAVARLMEAPERRVACGARARVYAERHFSLESVASRIEELYHEVCDRRDNR